MTAYPDTDLAESGVATLPTIDSWQPPPPSVGCISPVASDVITKFLPHPSSRFLLLLAFVPPNRYILTLADSGNTSSNERGRVHSLESTFFFIHGPHLEP